MRPSPGPARRLLAAPTPVGRSIHIGFLLISSTTGVPVNRALRSVTLLALVAGVLAVPISARAQDDAGPPPIADSTSIAREKNVEKYVNLYQGQFTPGAGFDVIRTERGSLNISVYGLFRYVNQTPSNQQFTDHLGNVRTPKMRNDINWHRTMLWVTGFFVSPKFRYNITGWSLASTEQTLIFGNLRYLASPRLNFGVGVAPNLTNRSLQGSWPFWASSDRQMAEEFLRGGFASGFWITGKLNRVYYTTSINRNISQLGNTTTDDNRDMAYTASIWAHPTTGEFGPRNGFGDLEYHEKLATQFGISAGTAREGRYSPIGSAPKATQIKLSDSVNPFEIGALADTVTVSKLTYQAISVDAGAKYRGFSIQGEFSYRRLSDFNATGPLPLKGINDRGFFVEAMHMVVPRKLGIYAATSYIMDDFKRYPWEVGGGASFYPYGNRQWRLNLHIMHVDRSPTGSNFGYYTGRMTGTIFSLGTDVIL